MKKIIIFTDGAAKGNPGPGGWGAVLLYSDRVQEIGAGKDNTTNNEMELKAVVEALKVVSDSKKHLEIYSDSKYVVQGATNWVFNWMKNGWKTMNKTEVLHKELWQELISLTKDKEIEWHKISGHVGLIGNECADKIASDFGDGEIVGLYDGPVDEYPHDIADVSYDLDKEKKRREARKRQNIEAYSYISKVDGEVKTHTTWGECEARVKGKRGVRFKKSISAEEEKKIIEEFGSS